MRIGLVLGGGGARGYAHIGVLRALEEHGLEPSAIAGCSTGGIIGALFGAGNDAEALHEMAEDVSLLRFLEFGERGGIFGGSGLETYLKERLPDTFAGLAIPLAVVAVDIQSGELLVLNEGELVPALRATSALPGILSPGRIDGRILVDGGVLNTLPVDVATSMTTDPVVAVDVSPPPDREIDFGEDDNLFERLVSGWRKGDRALVVEVLVKASELAQASEARVRLALHPPRLLIRPRLGADFGAGDFHRVDEAVASGYRGAHEALEQAGDALGRRGGAYGLASTGPT
jgi:NTE family protein